MRRLGLASLILYVSAIWLANLLITRFGLVPVGFGLLAPAGVYVVGLSFTLRDVVQDQLGKTWVVAAILAGAAVSALVSPALALASGVAFLLSEFADFAIYTPLRDRGRPYAALLVSNSFGLVLDSLIFLQLAFGSTDYAPGQILGKAWMTVAALPLIYAYRSRVASTPARS